MVGLDYGRLKTRLRLLLVEKKKYWLDAGGRGAPKEICPISNYLSFEGFPCIIM